MPRALPAPSCAPGAPPGSCRRPAGGARASPRAPPKTAASDDAASRGRRRAGRAPPLASGPASSADTASHRARARSRDHALPAKQIVDVSPDEHSLIDLGNALALALHQLVDEPQHFLDVSTRYDSDAVVVADDNVARHDDRAAARDRNVDLTRTILVAAPRTHGAAERGEAQVRDPFDVANRAIDHDAAELLGRGRAAHQVPEDRCGRASERVHDDDVTWLRDVECLVNHEIVRGTAEYRHRGSIQREAAPRSDARVHEIEPPHRVGDVRARHAAKARNQCVGDTRWRGKKTKSELAGHVLSVGGGRLDHSRRTKPGNSRQPRRSPIVIPSEARICFSAAVIPRSEATRNLLLSLRLAANLQPSVAAKSRSLAALGMTGAARDDAGRSAMTRAARG